MTVRNPVDYYVKKPSKLKDIQSKRPINCLLWIRLKQFGPAQDPFKWSNSGSGGHRKESTDFLCNSRYRDWIMAKANNGFLINLKDVHRTFTMGEVEVKVLRGIDLDVNAGELLIILGESGSGKSTLMNMIGGIDQPTSGSIVFNGQDITTFEERELTRFRRENVGFVFQFYNLVPTLSALENVATVTEIADNPMDPAEALELVGLGDRLDHFPSQLSGGQQQRVAIARALAKQPKLMLCDEPTGALDHDTSIRVLEIIQDINKKTDTTVVMITHAPPIAQMADRTALIADGRISEVKVSAAPKSARELVW